MDKERFLSSGLLEQYVLGLTTPDENREVERYLNAFPEIRADVEEMRKAIERYAMDHSIPPPPGKNRNGKNAGRDSSGKASGFSRPGDSAGEYTRTQGWLPWLSMIAALTFGFLSLFLYQRQTTTDHAFRKLTAEFAVFRQQCAQDKATLRELQAFNAFLNNTGTQPVHLAGTELAPQAEAIVFWNREGPYSYIHPANLPPPPSDHQYQVWADVNGEMINVGLILPDRPSLQKLNYIKNAESINITIEPTGGSATPTVSRLIASGHLAGI